MKIDTKGLWSTLLRSRYVKDFNEKDDFSCQWRKTWRDRVLNAFGNKPSYICAWPKTTLHHQYDWQGQKNIDLFARSVAGHGPPSKDWCRRGQVQAGRPVWRKPNLALGRSSPKHSQWEGLKAGGYPGKEELHHGTGNVGQCSATPWGWSDQSSLVSEQVDLQGFEPHQQNWHLMLESDCWASTDQKVPHEMPTFPLAVGKESDLCERDTERGLDPSLSMAIETFSWLFLALLLSSAFPACLPVWYIQHRAHPLSLH